MAVQQVSRIQHRRGLRVDLPDPLNDAEFGWCEDTKELFIGNGSFFGGNTKILTDASASTIDSLQYTYAGNTGTVAITGPSVSDPFTKDINNPIIRTLRQKVDDFVNVRDYGAVGDGLVDDAGAITRAIQDIYDETSSSMSEPRKFRILYFPAGTYKISNRILLYPFSRLCGAGKDRTKIKLDFTLSGANRDCVARTADSQGLTGSNIGTLGGVLPTDIVIEGIFFDTNIPQTEPAGTKNVIKVEKAKRIRFEDCGFSGIWVTSNPTLDGSIGIEIANAGGAINENISIINCEFKNTAYGLNLLEDTKNVYVVNSTFDNHFRGIKLAPDAETPPSPGNPELFRVTHSRFTSIEDIGFDVRSIKSGNISSYNTYSGTGGSGQFAVTGIRFDTGTIGCVSIGDTFEDDTQSPNPCATKLTNPRVQNHSTADRNIVMNFQDIFQIPVGFCGDVIFSNDIIVERNIRLDGKIINNKDPITPSGILITAVPYTDGNVIFFEYGMRLGGPGTGVYRIGTLRIVHNGDGTGTINPINSSDIVFSDTYTQLDEGSPPADSITLEAIPNGPGASVNINVITAGTIPAFNFSIRTMTV